jgi:hypothetical protein
MKRILTLFVFLIGAVASAQQTGSIVGTVHDPSGAVVPDASVKITSTETQFQRSVKTNGSGEYSAPSMPTGTYAITVDKSGFQKVDRAGVLLTGATTITVDIELAIGSDSQTVEVTSQVPLLQAQSGAVSNLVDSQQMVDLPLATRNYTDLVLLTPGAHAGTANNLAEGAGAYSIRGGTDFSVNGSIAAGNSYLIDGLYNRNQWLNTEVMVPIVDSIKEYRVLTSNFPAEYGNAAGAVTTVTTKNGTNQLHGTAFGFLRSQIMNANTFFLNQKGQPRSFYKRNTFGGTVGGPIIHDKLFFFADYQGIRQATPLVSNVIIPTAVQVGEVESGNFAPLLAAGCPAGFANNPATAAAICNANPADTVVAHRTAPYADGNQLYNPYSGTTTRLPFLNNLITTPLDPAAQNFAKLLPAPNATVPGVAANYTISPTSTLTDDQFDGRLDENLGATDRLFVKYSFDKPQALFPGSVYTAANAPFQIGPYVGYGGNGYNTSVTTQSGTVGYSHIFSPTLLLEANIGVLRWFADTNPLDESIASATAIGIPGVNYNQLSGGLPVITITGFAALGDNSTYPEDSRITTFQYSGDVIKTSGNHTIKAGVQFMRHRFNAYSSTPARGTFDFSGQYTAQINAPSAAFASLADFAIGASDSTQRAILQGEVGMRYFQLGFYVQDSWRATDRLTVEYGARYDIDTPPYEVHNHWANIDVPTGHFVVAGINGAGRTLRNTDYNTFQPRLGFAYTLDSARNTVLRSGFGITYVNELVGGSQLYKNAPFFFNQNTTPNVQAAPTAILSQGFSTPVAPSPTDQNAMSLVNNTPFAWDKNLKEACSLQYSLGVQHNFRGNILGEVSYVGSHGEHLLSKPNLDQAAPGPGTPASRRPYNALMPNLTAITYFTDGGNSHYDSLQARLERRMIGGLSFGASYTLAHYLTDTGDPNGGGNTALQNGLCQICNYGPAPNDFRHTLVFNHTLQLPFGKGRHFLNKGWISYLVGPWDFAGVWSIHSGDRSSVTYSTNVSNSSGGAAQRPNQIADPNLPTSQRNLTHWFNLAAFAAPAQYNFGNAGTGIVAGPGYFDADLTLERHLIVRNRFDIDLRGEAFNAFNRTNFGDPNTAIGNAQAGQISTQFTGLGGPRVGQVALKISF